MGRRSTLFTYSGRGALGVTRPKAAEFLVLKKGNENCYLRQMLLRRLDGRMGWDWKFLLKAPLMLKTTDRSFVIFFLGSDKM